MFYFLCIYVCMLRHVCHGMHVKVGELRGASSCLPSYWCRDSLISVTGVNTPSQLASELPGKYPASASCPPYSRRSTGITNEWHICFLLWVQVTELRSSGLCSLALYMLSYLPSPEWAGLYAWFLLHIMLWSHLYFVCNKYTAIFFLLFHYMKTL